MSKKTMKATYLKDYKKPDYGVKHADLSFEIFDDHTIVTANLEIEKKCDCNAPVFLDGKNLKLLSFAVNGDEEYEKQVSEKGLEFPCPAGINAGDTFAVKTVVEIHPETNTTLKGLFLSEGKFFTQCEPQGFRCITYFTDRPDTMGTFRVRIEADKKSLPVLLSNGNPVDEGDLENGRHFMVWEDTTPKPCYLFALVAGDLVHMEDKFTTRSGLDVVLRIYVKEGDLEQCHHAMESLKKAMKWDEDVYGREYQYKRFNIVATSDFNMGAMENTSLNIFNTSVILAHQETATDADFLYVERVIAHEYFHNWTGNRVTCRDWFQLSLKEGLTVFRDQSFTADMNSAPVQRIDDVTKLRKFQFPEDASPLAHPVRPDSYIEINNFYTTTVYNKGAEVIRMFHTLLQPETYRKATDLYFDRHDGQAVTCDDWAKCMEDASGRDLSQFKLWYSQAGTPEVDASWNYDEDSKKFTLTLKQEIPDTPGQKNKKPMHIPVAFGLVGANGDDLIGTRILELREKEQSFSFDNIPAGAVPSILRHFSAPVKLTTQWSDDDLRFLMVHDSDGFNRWEAGQKLALRVVADIMENGSEPDEKFMDSISMMLDQAMLGNADNALIARALTLPDVGIITLHHKEADPKIIYDARKKITDEIGKRFAERLQKIYDANNVAGEFDITPKAMGQRAIKNVCLKYLDSSQLAEEQYFNANNMTDRIAALGVLTHKDREEKAKVFDDFYERFKQFPLVVDKWFSMQAMAVRDDTLEHLKELTKHPDFTLKNPNRMRSLYSAFTSSNPVCFHDKSGAGYEFLKEAIIKLNYTNPQLASQQLRPMREWKNYTKTHQEKMKKALKDILEIDDISPDVFEIVSKTLNG